MVILLPKLFEGLDPKIRRHLLLFTEGHNRELSMHKASGLWEEDEGGESWKNVTEHCLMVAARVDVIGRLVGLSEHVLKELFSAALLHDFYKKIEILKMDEDISHGGDGKKGVLIAERESEKILREAGFSELVTSFIGCIGGLPETILRMKEILDMPDLKPENIAHLIIHYVDGYTCGSSFAEPAVKRGAEIVNDVDRRIEKNVVRYPKLAFQKPTEYNNNPFFNGMMFFEAQAAMGHFIGERITDILTNNGLKIESPLHLPQCIDERIISNAVAIS